MRMMEWCRMAFLSNLALRRHTDLRERERRGEKVVQDLGAAAPHRFQRERRGEKWCRMFCLTWRCGATQIWEREREEERKWRFCRTWRCGRRAPHPSRHGGAGPRKDTDTRSNRNSLKARRAAGFARTWRRRVRGEGEGERERSHEGGSEGAREREGGGEGGIKRERASERWQGGGGEGGIKRERGRAGR